MSALTLDDIQKLLSTNKQRGIYESDIQNAVDSGELATNFSELPYYKDKDVQAVRNSINLNIEKKSKEKEWPALTVVYDKVDPKDKSTWQVILVNMDVLAKVQAGDDNEPAIEDDAQV